MTLNSDSAKGSCGLLRFTAAVLLLIQVANGQAKDKADRAPQWQEIELEFNAAQIFDGLPFAEMQPNWTYTYGRRGLAVPGKFFVLYLPEGGNTGITSLEVPRAYRVYDPRSGTEVSKGRLPDQAPVQFNSGSPSEPRVVVFSAAIVEAH